MESAMNNRTVYVVKAGDSLWTIANQFNISIESLKQANGLQSNVITLGQELVIPVPSPTGVMTYTVQKGDSLWKIAQQYNTTVDQIKDLNHLQTESLYLGQHLQIPTPATFSTYTVQPGDSLWNIAMKFGVTVDDLKKINHLNSDQLFPGDVLNIGPSNGKLTYIVKPSDSLWIIANSFGMSVNELMSINQLTTTEVQPGQSLIVLRRAMPKEVTTVTYTVKEGDSLWSIANVFGTTVDQIKSINQLTTNTLTPGQKLTLYQSTTPSDANIYIKVKRYSGTIVSVPLEEYVTGVVCAELSDGFHTEAYKAQALTARTYAVTRLREGQTISDTASHQVYKDKKQLREWWRSDFDSIYQKIRLAVSQTKGEVITYNGELIDALFFSTSNGRTEDPRHIWGGSEPYLKSVDSRWDTKSPYYYDVKNITFAEFRRLLGLSSTASLYANILSRTEGDSVREINIAGKKFTGEDVRKRLALKSTDFDLKFENGKVIIRQRGWGHQVGLSQYGAHFMGEEGFSYREIIQHYYPGVTIKNLYY